MSKEDELYLNSMISSLAIWTPMHFLPTIASPCKPDKENWSSIHAFGSAPKVFRVIEWSEHWKKGGSEPQYHKCFPLNCCQCQTEPSIRRVFQHDLAVPRTGGEQRLQQWLLRAYLDSVCGQHRTDQGEQIKGWSGSSEYNSMFARKLPKPEKLGNYSWS